MSTAAQCPQCGREVAAPDAGGMVTCTCGYTGYLGYLQEYSYLLERQRWLWDRIQNRERPPAEPLAGQYGIWPVTPAPPVHPNSPASGGSTQILLVGLGAALVLMAGMVFVAVAWELIGPIGQLAALAVTTALFAVAAVTTRRRTPRTAEALAVVAFGLAAITGSAAPALGVVPQEWTSARYPYWLVIGSSLLAVGVVAGRVLGLQAWVWLGWLSAPFVTAAALGLVLSRVGNDEVDMTLAALAFLGLAAALMLTRQPPQLLAGILSLVPGAGLTLALLTQTPPAGAILVIAAVLLVLVLAGEGAWQDWVGWPLFGVWLALLAALLPPSALVSGVVALVGAVLLLWRAPHGPTAAVVTAGTVWTAWLVLDPEHISLVLAIAAAALFAVAVRPDAAPVAWIAALTAETALLLQWHDWALAEAPTLWFAALLLIAGGLQWRAGTRSSAIVLAPAISMALLPSAFLSWSDVWSGPSLARFLVVLGVGTVLLLVGVRRHILGLVVPAAAAIAVAGTAQVFATLDLLPRWLALGLVGGVLILIGARLEWLRARRRETQEWLESLR